MLSKLLSTCLLGSALSASVERNVQDGPVGPAGVPLYPGKCPIVHGDPNFNFSEYISKTWWAVATSPFFWYGNGTVCSTATYQESVEYPGNIVVFNTGYYQLDAEEGDYANYVNYTSKGMAAPIKDTTGELNVVFPYPTLPSDEPPSNYVVMATDSETYSFVWSCDVTRASDYLYRPLLWVLNRDQNLSQAAKQQQIDYALDLLKYKYQWEYVDQFAETMFEVPYNMDCPVPEHHQ